MSMKEEKDGPNTEDPIEPSGGTASEEKTSTEERPRRRGFAAMDRDRVKAIASKGGRAGHAAGTCLLYTSRCV